MMNEKQPWRVEAEKRQIKGSYLAAFRRGWFSAEQQENPYPDRTTDGGKVTFSRAWRNTWSAGRNARKKITGSLESSIAHMPEADLHGR